MAMAEHPTFGEFLRSLRQKRGMSQRDLAERVGLDFSYISKIENETMAPPSVEAIDRLATALSLGDGDRAFLHHLSAKVPETLADVLPRNPWLHALLVELGKQRDFDSVYLMFLHQLADLREVRSARNDNEIAEE